MLITVTGPFDLGGNYSFLLVSNKTFMIAKKTVFVLIIYLLRKTPGQGV